MSPLYTVYFPVAGLPGWSTYIGPFLVLLVVAVLGLVAWAVWVTLRLRRAERRYQDLTAGTTGGNLSEVLENHIRQVRQATRRVDELETLSRGLQSASRGHLQRLGFMRFNPFREMGGDQSFIVAVADADGNGFVISSLQNRDATRVYGKPLLAWQSSSQLTDEEQQVIRQARASEQIERDHGIQT